MGRIDNGIYPQPCCRVARIALVFIGCADGFVQFFLLLFIDFLAFALELFELDFHECAGRGIAAHHRVARRGPGKNEPGIIRFPAHRVMSGAEAATANHGNLGTTLLATALTIFAPARMMPLHSASLPTIKPFTSCKNTSGIRFWLQSIMKRA